MGGALIGITKRTKTVLHEGVHTLFSPTMERAIAAKVLHGANGAALARDLGVSSDTVYGIVRRREGELE